MREEFDEIRPYEAGEMKQAFDDLLNDRQFQMILKGWFAAPGFHWHQNTARFSEAFHEAGG